MNPDRDIARMIDSAHATDAHALAARCWPRDGDRTDAIAREWVRRWGPTRAAQLDWDPTPN